MDITYILLAKGFVYLACVLDWYTRRVLSWRLSITMDTSFCIEAVQEAVEKHGSPDIFNTDSKSVNGSLPSLRPAHLSQQAT